MKCQCVGGPYDGYEHETDSPAVIFPMMPSYVPLWVEDDKPLIMQPPFRTIRYRREGNRLIYQPERN